MNYPYPRFFLDIQLAKKRLAQALATQRDAANDSLSRPANKGLPAVRSESRPYLNNQLGLPRHRLESCPYLSDVRSLPVTNAEKETATAQFMAIGFFRQGFGRHGPGSIFGVPGRRKHDDRKMAQHISPTESCRMMQKSG